jgi:hypothetical protein
MELWLWEMADIVNLLWSEERAMKWMLVVIVFGLGPVKTDLLYNSLEECLGAEASVRAEWTRLYNAAPKERREDPTSAAFMRKQMTSGTCIPHANILKRTN